MLGRWQGQAYRYRLYPRLRRAFTSCHARLVFLKRALQVCDRECVRRGVFRQQEAPLAVRCIQRGTVNRPDMVDGHGAGGTGQHFRARDIQAGQLRVERTAEIAVGVVVVHRSLVRAWQDHQRPVGLVAVVEQDAGGEDVVVRVGVESPVLVPFDRRAVAGGLHVHLGAIDPNVRPDQLRDDIRDIRIAEQVPEIGKVPVGFLDPAHAGIVGGMAVLKVIDLVVRPDARGLGENGFGLGPQSRELFRTKNSWDDDIAFLVIFGDLFFC